MFWNHFCFSIGKFYSFFFQMQTTGIAHSETSMFFFVLRNLVPFHLCNLDQNTMWTTIFCFSSILFFGWERFLNKKSSNKMGEEKATWLDIFLFSVFLFVLFSLFVLVVYGIVQLYTTKTIDEQDVKNNMNKWNSLWTRMKNRNERETHDLCHLDSLSLRHDKAHGKRIHW